VEKSGQELAIPMVSPGVSQRSQAVPNSGWSLHIKLLQQGSVWIHCLIALQLTDHKEIGRPLGWIVGLIATLRGNDPQSGKVSFQQECTDGLNQLLILQVFQRTATNQMGPPVDTF
jgi:hypothetical protein